MLLTAIAYSFSRTSVSADARRRSHCRVRAVIQEVLTAHFFITQPRYLKWMLEFKDVKLQI